MPMWPTARLFILVATTGVLAYVSRRSLLRPRTHGFFRFFVFEAILALCLLNLPVWFDQTDELESADLVAVADRLRRSAHDRHPGSQAPREGRSSQAAGSRTAWGLSAPRE